MSVPVVATITYAPPVPALDLVPVVILATLTAYFIYRSSSHKASKVLWGGVIFLLVSQWQPIADRMLKNAGAIPSAIEFTSASGGSANMGACGSPIPVDNLTGSDQVITGINLVAATSFVDPTPSSPQCTVGFLVPANTNNACYLEATGCPP